MPLPVPDMLKNCSSAANSGRVVSVGIQYLSTISVSNSADRGVPDSMQLVRQRAGYGACSDEILDFLDFVGRPAFEPTRVVENKLAIAFEDQLVFDIVLSALGHSQK